MTTAKKHYEIKHDLTNVIEDVRKGHLDSRLAHAIYAGYRTINGTVNTAVRYHRHRGEIYHHTFMDPPSPPTPAKKRPTKKAVKK